MDSGYNLDAPEFDPTIASEIEELRNILPLCSIPKFNILSELEAIEPSKESLTKQTEKPVAVKTQKKSESQPVRQVVLPKDAKETINVVFIGHVDAGKSTIGGQILVSTGNVDQRTLEKYQKEAKEKSRESWYLSWALDTSMEERDKGITVEVGKAVFELEHKRILLLDAPGHKDFIPNMITGASQADVAILVISARKGEFEAGFVKGGQTSEHALLVKSFGTQSLIVLINKMDDPSVLWDKERYDEIVQKLSLHLKKKIGYKQNDLIFLPCSGFLGENIRDQVDPKLCPWYTGKSLLQILDEWPKIEFDYDGPLRIAISERYKDMGFIISGKVVSGTLFKNDSVYLMPNKILVKVSAIYENDDVESEFGRAGQNLRFKVTGIDDENLVQPGSFICDTQNPCSVSSAFEAQIMIVDAKTIIPIGFKAIIHLQCAIEEVELIKIVAKIDPKTGESRTCNLRYIKDKDVCMARFQIAKEICLFKSEDCPSLARFTLRDETRTIAFGKVLKIQQKKSN